MHYVYLIESANDRNRHYVGQTDDLKARIIEHNSGKSMYTSRFGPWQLVCYLGFAEGSRALDFERYLKSGSGKTFLKRHFLCRWLLRRGESGPAVLSAKGLATAEA